LSGGAEETRRVPGDELTAEIAEEGVEAEVPEIFVEVPETRAEREHFDPGLASTSAEALHAAATGAVRIDRGIEASKPGGEGQGGKVALSRRRQFVQSSKAR